MIKSIKNKRLEQYFTKDDKKALNAKDIKRIERILDRLDSATVPDDMNMPGWDFHKLKGDRMGAWSVTVRKNWKITFRFKDGDAYDIDLEDYH